MKNPYAKQEKDVDKLVLEFIPLVKKIANKLSFRVGGFMDLDDLVQTGILGLIDAAQKFDPTRDNKFKTYAEFRIRGSMLDELRARDWVPRSVRDAYSKLDKAINALRNRGIDRPADDQLAAELDIEEKDLPAFLTKSKAISIISFEDMGHFLDEDMNILETISQPNGVIPEDFTLKSFDKNSLASSIKELTEKEQLVLSLCYQEDMSLKEIADILSLTESRVSQIRTKAVATLRSVLREEA